MKAILILLVALVIGAVGGSIIKNLPGFVIIAYENTTYEMRLWIAVCLLLLVLIIIILLVVVVRSFFASAGKVKNWHGGRNWRRSRKRTIQGMLAFTEGRWKTAEEAMVSAADSSDTPLINYLIAAQAAQQQNAEVRRDAYLRLAHKAEPAAKVAIGLTQAQLQLQHGQYEQALASLSELKAQNPNHPYVLKLLSRLFEKLQEWDQLLLIIPALKKQAVYQQAELQRVEQNCVTGILESQVAKADVEGLRDSWQKLPSAQRKSRENAIGYARLLVEFDQMEEADSILKPLIKKRADADLLALYGNVISSNPTKQLSFLESWLHSREDAPREIFLTLGKVAFNAKLWGKARQFLEQALQRKPTAEAYLIMAKTLTELGDEQHAMSCYQQGLEFVTTPMKRHGLITLEKGSEDLVQANLLPRFQKLSEE